jgi:multimeric flavodoxin WrbA
MKIVMVNGQNHKGSTYHIGRLLIDGITTEKEVKELFLPHDLNHFCMGCYACIEDETKCPYYEEKNKIMVEIEQADLLVFTTPNYCMAPSAPMKSFIDLTFTYWMSHKPRTCMFSKRAVCISTTAGMGAKQAIKPVKRTLFYWGVPHIDSYGISVQASSWKDVSENIKARIEKDMKVLAHKLYNEKKPSVPIKTKLMFFMFAKMQKADFGSSKTEKEYWKKQGWLEREKPWKKN